ncbi:MAG: hypothetical protein NDJ90_05510 [Oligoflexia bacterium]|nr:hypothetical protein [Oligoflexia bacterium]
MSLARIFQILLPLLIAGPAAAATACDVLKVEFLSGGRVFAGSAFAVRTSLGSALLTADHVYPVDAHPSRIRLTSGGNALGDATILRRDWSSDLLLLAVRDEALLKTLRPCLSEQDGPIELAPGTRLRMRGYSTESFVELEREATLVDARAPEIRLARPVRLVQVLGVPEKGMSGGVLETLSGRAAGVLIQDWVSANHALKGGAYALPADFVVKRAAELLRLRESVEAPLPFLIRRDAEELVAGGFRFRTTRNPWYGETPRARLMMGGGGHPDGIGGNAGPTAIEVIGLSGEEIAPELRPMEKLLRRIQTQGGVEMLVFRTADGRPARSILELARVLLEAAGALPKLEYSLHSIAPERPAPANESIDSLLEEAVVDCYRLADLNAELRPLAQLAQRAFERWVAERSAAGVQSFLEAVPAYDPALDRILDFQPGAWSRVIELRVRLRKIARKLALG